MKNPQGKCNVLFSAQTVFPFFILRGRNWHVYALEFRFSATVADCGHKMAVILMQELSDSAVWCDRLWYVLFYCFCIWQDKRLNTSAECLCETTIDSG